MVEITYKRSVKIKRRYDVIVCGGGPSGCTAALAARREGLSVLIVERQEQLGGTATSGLISHWLGGRTQNGEWIVGGLFRSLVKKAVARGAALLPVLDPNTTYQPHAWLPWFIHGIPLEPLNIAVMLDEEMQTAGIDVLLQTQVVDVASEDNLISSAILAGKEGLSAVSAAAFVDATGDADIAVRSGCEFRTGRESDGLMTPATLAFHAEGVDHDKLSAVINANHTPKFRDKIKDLRESGIWCFPCDIFISVQLVDDDTAMINTSRMVGIDGTNQNSITEGLMRGRREAEELMSILRDHFPGFTNARIRRIASMLGIRETRRILGNFELTVNDLVSGTEFSDCIGFSIYGWDLPHPEKPSYQPLVDESRGRYENLVEKSLSTPIPYRVLLPRPVKNLICTGRCVSVERDVLGPIRVMAPSMAMGEAAGTACAQVVGRDIAFESIDIQTLRDCLRKHECIVDTDALPEITPRQDP